MKFTDEQIAKAEINASPAQLNLYGSEQAGEKLHKIFTSHETFLVNKFSFYSAIGDVILGLVPQEKLPDLLIERLHITRPEAMKVTADVLDFLAPLSRPTAATPAAAAATPAPAVPRATAIPASEPVVSDEALAAEIAQAEATLQAQPAVQPMRTMAHDMQVAQTPQADHQSLDQADLLQRGPGARAKNPDANWDTTQS